MRVITSDHPEMSAEKLADELSQKISGSDINFFVANFANTDMVGHTGNLLPASRPWNLSTSA